MYPYDTGSQMFQNQLLQTLGQTPKPTERHAVKVNGMAGAEAFSMAPNSDDVLIDMNEPIIYFIQTDGAGYKTINAFDISPHKVVNPKDQIKSLEERISKLEEALTNGKSNYGSNNQKPKSGFSGNDAGNRSNAQG